LKYRTLGRTGVKVSLLGFGTGGARKFGVATGLDAEGRRDLVHRCLDLGVNFFDTAGGYGDSESFLGESLAGIDRDAYVLCTKWNGGHWLAHGGIKLVASVERSLKRMRTDHVDVFLFHMMDTGDYREHVDRLYPQAVRLKESGKIRHIGFTQALVRDPKGEGVVLALSSDPDLWEVVMLRYGIMNQWSAKEAMPLARKHHVGLINMAAVRSTFTDSGVLARRLDPWRADGTIAPDALTGDQPLDWLIHDDVGSLAEAAYRLAAEPEEIGTVLSGTAKIEHLEANVAALERGPLPEADRARLFRTLSNSWSPD